ncbi:MAG: cytidylate kinase family protein [bacterium]|nr:cytidylate kinase family protein [bacterium]
MAKPAIITITGLPGSGKSSTAKRVAEILAYKHFSSGDLFRKIAADRGLSVSALNLTAEEQREIDYEVDRLLQNMAKTERDIVIDSRLAFHWMPNSFKVFLKIDPETSAERTFSHIQSEGRVSEAGSSLEEVKKDIETRVQSERKRYRTLYDVDYTDESRFDLVVDTAKHPLLTVADIIVEKYRAWRGA